MARPKAFDRDEALEKAMNLFWEKGFAATSLPDLLGAMGIGRQSLYDTFGGKQQLFMECLTRYRDMLWKDVAPLREPGVSMQDIRSWFERMVDFYSNGEHRRACFLMNCTIELAPHDPQIADFVHEHYEYMEDAVTHAVEGALAQGQISTKDPRSMARVLLSATLGMGVFSKAGHSRETLEDIADSTVATFK